MALHLTALCSSIAFIALLLAVPAHAQSSITPEEARAIAKEAYVYGYPMVDNLRVQYAYFTDRSNPEYKAPYNQLFNIPRVFTPDDRAIQTPNSDTPYSWIGLDLRTEPIVFTVPAIPKERYWKGETPKGITKVIHSETNIASAQFRTQLFNPDDLENVKRIQSQYVVQPLSVFFGQPAPVQAPAIAFPKPLSAAEQKSSLEFFNSLNFGLQFAPVHPSETALMARFARINVGAGRKFDVNSLSPEIREAFEQGIADAWAENEATKQQIVAGKLASGDLFGTRDYLKNNYTYRMLAAVLGIYGNSKQEAMYPAYYADANGKPLSGDSRYTLRFALGQEPPVDAFWSLAMYDEPNKWLVANPISRYPLNSTMLAQFKRDANGDLTLYVQNASPGKDKEANWLPAPNGLRKGLLTATPLRENDIAAFSGPLTQKMEAITPNTVTPYITAYTDLRGGPVVLEVPASTAKSSLYGQVVDHWQITIADVGPAGVDKGKGGKYLFLPPGYAGAIPEGYVPIKSGSNRIGFAFRSVRRPGATNEDAYNYTKLLRMYPLAVAANPLQQTFVDPIDMIVPTLPRYDIGVLEDIKEMIDAEPVLERDKVMMGMLATIGVEKGKSFNPDPKLKPALERGVRDAYFYMQGLVDRMHGPICTGLPATGVWSCSQTRSAASLSKPAMRSRSMRERPPGTSSRSIRPL